MEKLSFIIPCYGSENTIENVVKELVKTVESLSIQYDYEVMLVNDSSPDNVYEVICKLCEDNKHVKGVNLAKNFGQHSAIMAGMNYATGDYYFFLDDDGQTPVEEFPKLLDGLLKGSDVVYAKYEQKNHAAWRNIGSSINEFMIRILMGKPKDIYVASFFACKSYVADEMKSYKNPYPYLAGLVFRSCNNISNVYVNHQKRSIGKSGYTFSKLISLWINGFTAFSVKPLRIVTLIGTICSMIGFVFGIIVVVQKLFRPDIAAGYSSTMAVMLFMGGLLMLSQGLIGEYIGRMYISLNKAPQFVVKDTKNTKM